MSQVHKLVRLTHEIEECGGDPKLLFQKLESVLKLTEQIDHLEGTLQGVKHRIAKTLEEERAALSRRDDAVEAQKAAEKQLAATTQNLATMLRTEPEAKKIVQGIEQAENHLANVKQEAATIERFIAPARWFLCLLFDRPDLLRRHRQVLDQPPAKQEYTENIGQQIIQLAIEEVRKHGDLVPKTKYIQASLAADNLKRLMDSIIKPFLQNPKQLTLEQRRLLLGVLVDSGLTTDNLEQFRSQLAISWRKCQYHKEIDLKVNLRTLKFECTIPGCTYSE